MVLLPWTTVEHNEKHFANFLLIGHVNISPGGLARIPSCDGLVVARGG